MPEIAFTQPSVLDTIHSAEKRLFLVLYVVVPFLKNITDAIFTR